MILKNKSSISKFNLLAMALFISFALVLMTGCNGGGGDGEDTPAAATTLSGTAAAGAPIVGTVTIKDSSSPAQTKTVTIEADGNYTVDVSDMTAPYLVRADGYVGGNDYHLYSAGTSADVGGTINITPLTDLIVANIAGEVARDYFEHGDFSGLTAEELTAQAQALKAKLLPVLQALGVSDSIDLLRASFNTDHTGMDAALDILRVSTDPGTQVATITNIITQEQMTSNLNTGTYSGELVDTTGVAAGVTDIQAITAGFKKFSALFATSIPNENNATLRGLFDSATFMDDGEDLDVFLSHITTDPDIVGISFENIAIQSIDPTEGTAVVSFEVIQNGMTDKDGTMLFHMIKKSGAWYMQGNQRIANVNIETRAQYSMNPQNTQIQTGLNFNIEDRGGKGITSAVVSGPGLTAPVTLVSQISNEWFTIEGDMNGNMYFMTDSQIGAIADTGAVYTVDLYIGSTKAATYTETLKKRPYLHTELTAASFPTITGPTMGGMQSFTGGEVTVTWTLPAGLTNDWLEANINDNTGNSARYETTPAPATTSESFTLDPITSTGQSFMPTNGWISITASDSFGRQLSVGSY